MTPANFQQLANFIWSVADLLRGPYRPPQYERVMLPLTVLRRFDSVLEPTKDAVLKKHAELTTKGQPNIDAILNNLAKDEDGKPLGFHNHSQLDFYKLKGDPDNIGRHLADYINGFSENIRKIFEHEQQGAERAKYGKALLKDLSTQLTAEFGRGFSRSNLEYMRIKLFATAGFVP